MTSSTSSSTDQKRLCVDTNVLLQTQLKFELQGRKVMKHVTELQQYEVGNEERAADFCFTSRENLKESVYLNDLFFCSHKKKSFITIPKYFTPTSPKLIYHL